MLTDAQTPDTDSSHLLFDYERAQEMIRHYETLFWQVGAIVVAGLFIGLSNNNLHDVDQFGATILPTLLVLSFWFLWHIRTRALVLSRFRRLREIEGKIAELSQTSSSYTEDNKRLEVSFWKNPRQWIFARTTHSCLIRMFCLLLPGYLIFLYMQSYHQQRGLDAVAWKNFIFFVVPLGIFLFYPEPSTPGELY